MGLDRKVAPSRRTERRRSFAALGGDWISEVCYCFPLPLTSCCDLEVVPLLISFYLIDHMSRCLGCMCLWSVTARRTLAHLYVAVLVSSLLYSPAKNHHMLPLARGTPRINAKSNTNTKLPISKQRKQKPTHNQAHPATRRQLQSSTSRRRSSTSRTRRSRDDHTGRSSSNLITKNFFRRTTDTHCRRVDVPDTRGDFARGHRRS